jgi:hypothetical protein
MRILDFVVDKQTIAKSDKCNFGDLVAGTTGYLQARFCFSREWSGYRKVAVFTCKSGEYPVLIESTMCAVPDEVAACTSFKVTVVGKRGGSTLTCGRTTVVLRRC